MSYEECSRSFRLKDMETDVDIYDFMQFTGLKDKNGKDIYEGDILKEAAPRGYVFKVEFEGGAFIKYQISKNHSHFSNNLQDSLGYFRVTNNRQYLRTTKFNQSIKTHASKMKLLILMFIPMLSIAQNNDYIYPKPPVNSIGVGLTAGYSSRQSSVAEMYLSLNSDRKIALYPISVKVHLKNEQTIPVIFESRIGYKLNKIEFYGGYGYHIAGNNEPKIKKQYNGIYPAVGCILHVYRNFIITTGLSRFDKNKVLTIQLGLFK